MSPSAAVESPRTRWIIAALSVFVFAAVVVSLYAIPKPAGPAAPTALATLNACLNAAAGVLLVCGWAFVKRGDLRAHKSCMVGAFAVSSLFLVTYLLHHAQVGSVKFQGTGVLRAVYFAFLIPHIVLAAVVVPLALFTLYRGWTNRVAAHRRIARITLPVWLFVSVSGVVVYLMLYQL